MSTLTDRYVWAVVRLLPTEQRPDIDRELRSLIGDMTEEHLDAGGAAGAVIDGPLDEKAIETAVLTELGDPRRLASRYVATQRSLIGPELYPSYERMLKLVLAIAVPTITVLSVLGQLLEGDSNAGDIVGALASGAFGSLVMTAFWVTAVYAAIERWDADSDWSIDELPDAPANTADNPSRGESVIGIAFTLITAALLVWQHFLSPMRNDAGERVPVLDPAMWNGPAQLLLVILAASLAVQVVVAVRGTWTMPLAATNAAVNAASLAVVAFLAFDERFINHDFLVELADRSEWDTVPTPNPWIIVLVFAAIEVWDAAEGFLRARRTNQAGTPLAA